MQLYQRNIASEQLPTSTATLTKTTTLQNKDKLAAFTPQTVPNGSHAVYDLSFTMGKEGRFTAKAAIQIENRSQDVWDKLVFYFIPNTFTKQNKPDLMKNVSDVRINHIKLDQQNVLYQLSNDTLIIPLINKMKPGEKAQVTISYQFDVPKNGIRFSQQRESYYLAQACPMIATYNKGWNKKDYLPFSESYHTGYADFTVSYDIPLGYTFVSSSDQTQKAIASC